MKITFGVAKLAKEKGFVSSKYCLHAFYPDGKEWSLKYEFINGYVSISDSDMLFLENEYIIERPTQSELQEWLRKNYHFHITINVGLPHGAKKCQYYSNIIKMSNHHKNKFRSVFYEKYEDALEIALLETLKLIYEPK